ncbi:hypothetical protein KKF81_00905 [Candidatus Micrarchaeota archaeon]|nr:hypothetical protein [Candidatus Micrarchaeota archaeon]MBU1165478.1 hypothetical protein [Candidatus Micrarchaeota archaeon]MBU1886316.1 hypothetical protein [Candidatus Micrarchaeota archaeon]
MEDDNQDNKYKSIDSAFAREIRSDLEQNMQKFRDPIVLGEMVYRLMEERENTNRLLRNILQKLDLIENKLGQGAKSMETQKPVLPLIDEEILAFVKEIKKASAEEVRVKFKYKGKNAASARLNRLCNIGLLEKKQAGKKVFFFPR